MELVNDFLVVYLHSIDEGLLEYLDEDDELKLMRHIACAPARLA
jgi:hypothetical protein